MGCLCMNCTDLDLKRTPPMARQGFGNCKHQPLHKFFSVVFDRECEWFRPADPDVVKARVDWYERKGKQ